MTTEPDNINFIFTKMDRRHTGNEYFKYYVKVASKPIGKYGTQNYNTHAAIIMFNILRNWCIDTWGPSCELNTYMMFAFNNAKNNFSHPGLINQHWAWNCIDQQKRIYLIGDEELAWVELRWK